MYLSECKYGIINVCIYIEFTDSYALFKSLLLSTLIWLLTPNHTKAKTIAKSMTIQIFGQS